jgi:hypothetical protein
VSNTLAMSNTLIISYNDWYNYIKINKIKILKNIDSSSFLDGSKINKIFTNLLQGLFNTDVFDISRVSYLAFSFLDLYINSYLTDIIRQNNSKPVTTSNVSSPTLSTKKQIHNILYFIINLVIHIELTLNLHLFMLIYLLKKQEKNSCLRGNLDTTYQHKFIKPRILLKFEKIYNDIELNIEPSSILLLLLKINYKISNIFDYLDNDIILNEKDKDKDKDKDKNKEITNKINKLLDSFILSIEQQSSTQSNTYEKYSICINYMLDFATLAYSYFDLGFGILVKYLKNEYPDKKDSFDIIQKTISTFLKNEITTLEKKLLE